jgi:hypothetical protein
LFSGIYPLGDDSIEGFQDLINVVCCFRGIYPLGDDSIEGFQDWSKVVYCLVEFIRWETTGLWFSRTGVKFFFYCLVKFIRWEMTVLRVFRIG